MCYLYQNSSMKNPNDYIKQKERALKRKLELIRLKGSKCSKCGYEKNISALDFHHIDASQKEFSLDARNLSNKHLDKLKREIEKCVLLCANCHRETHYPQFEKDNLQKLLDECHSNNVSVEQNKHQKSICPHCKNEFKSIKGKIYCSKQCRINAKNYPTKNECLEKYNELKSWEKVAQYYNLTRKIIKGIIQRN